jgi:hypothetical protein
MSQANLASNIGGFWVLAHLYPVLFGIVVGIVVIGFLILVVWGQLSAPRLITGSARVLSFAKSAADQRGRCWCRIELEVNIPGRDPYVTLMEQQLVPDEMAAIQQGMTVPVQVDATDQHKVRIDVNQPIT